MEKLILRNIVSLQELEENKKIVLSIPTPTQMEIINYILEHMEENIYQRDLENILNLRRATVSGVLQTMEKNNLIKRITDDNDTRAKKIILCEKAKEIFLKSEKRFVELEEAIVEGISNEELEVFLDVIKKMKENMKKQNNIERMETC